MNKNDYIKQVMKQLYIPRKMKKRLLEDLEERIDRGYEEDPFFNIVDELGHPDTFAKELAENYEDIYEDYKSHSIVHSSISNSAYEYKSKKSLFGLPLVHINTGGRFGVRHAKGIVAIGDLATGLVSMGGVSLGLVSIGGISLGGIALGGVAIGVLALGGVAIGLLALGGAAFAILKAIGGFASIL